MTTLRISLFKNRFRAHYTGAAISGEPISSETGPLAGKCLRGVGGTCRAWRKIKDKKDPGRQYCIRDT
jgi:hypothetical protein